MHSPNFHSLIRNWQSALLWAVLMHLPVSAHALTLPHNLSTTEVAEVGRIVGGGTAIRVLRSAEPYEQWPGVKFGFEAGIAPVNQINDYGDRDGVIDGMNIVPRLYIAKGLPWNLEFMFVWFPDSFINTIGSLGGMLKWSFFNEQDGNMSLAAYVSATNAKAFDRTVAVSTWEAGGILSKDFVRLKPYAGMGIMQYTATVDTRYVAVGAENQSSTVGLHLFLGLEFEYPLHITVQADLVNYTPGFTLLAAKRF